jgi:hypothetical protein
MEGVSQERGDQFAAHTGFDPRRPDSVHRWFWSEAVVPTG